MSGAISPFPQYTFMALRSVKKKSTGTTLPYPLMVHTSLPHLASASFI